MKSLYALIFLLLFIACSTNVEEQIKPIYITGKVASDVKYLTIGEDTIPIKDGLISDTIFREEDQYTYLKLNSWKWPRIVYLKTGESLPLTFKENWVATQKPINEFLLNKDSLLIQYTAGWNDSAEDFRATWAKEFPINLGKIDEYFKENRALPNLVEEVKQMEYMIRGHRTANFISYQARKGVEIDRNIYDFVQHIDLKNERLAFHVNNQNFQYYYYRDKVSDEVPDSIYPFAIIDTTLKYVHHSNIKNMLIKSAVKSGLYDETVDHDKLFDLYERHIGEITIEDEILKLYAQIHQLKPGKPAPDFGQLTSLDGTVKTIDDFKGRNILLTVWGTWCPYCKEELPYIKQLAKKYPDQLEIVAISLDKAEDVWQEYLLTNDWSATHLIDPNRQSEFRKNYLISGTNICYLIDKNGIIVTAHLKPSNPALEALISQLE